MSADSGSRPRLTSWKEIARALGRDVRTVQRWEHEGLPVHRPPGDRRRGVFAYPDELEDWLHGRVPAEPAPEDLRPTGRVRFVGAAAIVVLLLTATASVLAWIAFGHDRPAATGLKVLATSRTPLRMPRWAQLDGDGKPDLIVSSERSPVLIFLAARDTTCRVDAQACAGTRIHAPDACFAQVNYAADVNGDGLDDVLVACLLREPESFNATGASWIVWGRRTWPADLTLPDDAGVTLAASRPHDDRVHACLNDRGRADVNGDGLEDVLIGGGEVPFNGRLSSGAVYIFFGRRTWPAALRHEEAEVTIGGSRMGEGLGNLCAVGDFNGDGKTDIAANADEQRLWNLLGGAGRTYVIAGRATWPRVIDLAHEPAMRLAGLASGTGEQQLAFADIDGDGRDEFFLSAPMSPWNTSAGSLLAVWRGGELRAAPFEFLDADVIFKGSSPSSRLGNSLARSDLDRDGHSELLAADPGSGEIHVVSQADSASTGATYSKTAVARRLSPPPSSMAMDDETLALVTSGNGEWKLSLLEPFSNMAIDVRPHNQDDVVLRPGITAIGIVGQRRSAAIDPGSLRAAGAAPIAHTTEDFSADGVPDLIVRFKTEEMNLAAEATSLTVVGRTRDGGYVRGRAAIRLVATGAARVR